MRYTYLIVDDEAIERKGIRMLLNRIDLDMEILEAANGEDAVRLMQETQVDILLTDINMPFMGGIELLHWAKQHVPSARTVIFSGYDEFSYAKQAITFGVSAYILKPVNPEEFEKTIRKLVRELDDSEQEERRRVESRGVIREHLLYLMVNGKNRASLQGYRAAPLVDLGFVDAYRRMILVECRENYFEQMPEGILNELAAAAGMPFQYLNLTPQQSLFIFSGEADGGWEALARRLYTYFKTRCRIECFLAVSSDMQEEKRELFEYVAQVDRLMEQSFFQETEHVFLPLREKNGASDVQTDAGILFDQMKFDIRMKDMEGLEEHFSQFGRKYRKQNFFSEVYIKFVFSSILKEIYEQMPQDDERWLDREIDQLYRSADMQGVIGVVWDAIRRLEDEFLKNGGASGRREVERVRQYIAKHYPDCLLGVDQLAAEVGMTPNYLSSIFKRETGENLSKYIKNYRMEKAKELLLHTEDKIGAVCEACGFVNVSYFCQSFRESFGVSPQKYREQGK